MVKFNSMEMVRIWAVLTGLFLVLFYFGQTWIEGAASPIVAMLATSIAGFEIFFFSQDQWLKRRKKHG